MRTWTVRGIHVPKETVLRSGRVSVSMASPSVGGDGDVKGVVFLNHLRPHWKQKRVMDMDMNCCCTRGVGGYELGVLCVLIHVTTTTDAVDGDVF